ncbi:MAG: hypothetical protein ABSA72_01970 [Nitrososphaerales archaeon]|jgi:hypothetical protein
MDSAGDWGGGRDEGGGSPPPGQFGAYADSECFRCSEVTVSKTAEMLYMSSEWDYYYCYRCRGWFKRLFSNEEVVLPVTDRRVISHLTWMYASQMEAIFENRRMLEQVGRVWHGLERRLPRILQ